MTKLSQAQTKAMERITAEGILHSFNGVSRATVRKLEELGLIEVQWKVVNIDPFAWGHTSAAKPYTQLEFIAKPKGE